MKNELLAKITEKPHEINGSRVILFSEIASILGRKRNSTLENFKRNIDCYTKNADYFYLSREQGKKMFGVKSPQGCYALTESGFMILANNLTAFDAKGEQAIMQYFKAGQLNGPEHEVNNTNEIAKKPFIRFIPNFFENVLVKFIELKELVSMLCDNATTPDEKTMALHTIEDVLELRVNEFESLLYEAK